MAYHFFQAPALSPDTNRIACRRGSKAKRIRISLRPLEPGCSSLRFLCLEPVSVSTNGQSRVGPGLLARVVVNDC